MLPLVVLVGCFSKPPAPGVGDAQVLVEDALVDGPGARWLSNYTYRRAIVITRPAGAVDTLMDFPVSVRIDAADFMMHTNGTDLVFTADDGETVLASESYTDVTGLAAWVRVPSLSSTTTTVFLYYGGPPATALSPPTWSSFLGAWHMDSPDFNEVDSSVNVVDVTSPGIDYMPDVVPGVDGDARLFDGVSDHLCTGTQGLSVGTSSFGYSVWIEISGLPAKGTPLYRGADVAGNRGFAIEIDVSPWRSSIADGTGPTALELGDPIAGWTQLAVTLDRGSPIKATTYMNGRAHASYAFGSVGSLDPGSNFCIGDSSRPFAGAIDEVRIYRSAVSADWIRAEYGNLQERSSFIKVGAEETL